MGNMAATQAMKRECRYHEIVYNHSMAGSTAAVSLSLTRLAWMLTGQMLHSYRYIRVLLLGR